MACFPLLIVTSLLATGAEAFAPIQWARVPGKGMALMPKSFAGHHIQSFAVPQELTIGETIDTMVPNFKAKSDNTISVAGWCVEAAGEKRGDVVLVNNCDGGPAQQWNWIPDGHGRNMIQLKNSNLCLDVVEKTGSLNGASVDLQDCQNGASESWLYEATMSVPEEGALLSSDARHVTITLIVLGLVGVLSLSAWFFGRSTTPVVAGGVPSSYGQEGKVSSTTFLPCQEGGNVRSPSTRRGVIRMSMDDTAADDLEEGGVTADGTVISPPISFVDEGFRLPRLPVNVQSAAAVALLSASFTMVPPAFSDTSFLVAAQPAIERREGGAEKKENAKITGGGASTLQQGRSITITRGVNLNSTNWQGENLKGVAFQQSVVRDANFDKADLKTASFFDADLSNSSFRDADMELTNLEMADLTNADLTGANLTQAYMTGAIVNGPKGGLTKIDNTDWTDAQLNKAQTSYLCKFAKGENPKTGMETRVSLMCKD